MAKVYDVYFASNRDFNGSLTDPKFGERFNDDGPQYFRVGRAKVERKGGDDYKYKSGKVVSEKPNENILGSRSLFDDLRQTLQTTKQDVIVYIHGFANTFESSIERGAQLHHEYEITPRPDASGKARDPYRPIVFAFSWPSNGRVFPKYEYQSDRDDARLSGVAMARALLRLVEYLKDLQQEDRRRLRDSKLRTNEFLPNDDRLICGQCIHLVAHSMGNWALRHAVNRLAEELQMQPLPRIFDHVFLMAADEDDDALEHLLKLARLPGLAKFVHVYHSRGDLALDVSDVTKGNPNRLGEIGPENMDPISDRVYAIDCADVDQTDVGHANHQYYRLRPEVIEDVRQVLSGKSFDAIDGRVPTARTRSFRILAKDERG